MVSMAYQTYGSRCSYKADRTRLEDRAFTVHSGPMVKAIIHKDGVQKGSTMI